MSKGVYVALSGAVAQQNAMDTTAVNVANASTAGYQRMRPVFRQALAGAVARDGGLRYTTTSRTALDTTPGPTRVTDRDLDVALPRGVYLAVNTARGERYTRAGSLTAEKDGTLKTASGSPLASAESGEPIKISPTGGPARVEPDGSVKQGANTVGKLKLVSFEKPDSLEPEGSGLLAPGGAGAATKSTELITVGAVEESNAPAMLAMTELMTASRTFEAFQKVLEQFGEIDRKLLTTVPNAVE